MWHSEQRKCNVTEVGGGGPHRVTSMGFGK